MDEQQHPHILYDIWSVLPERVVHEEEPNSKKNRHEELLSSSSSSPLVEWLHGLVHRCSDLPQKMKRLLFRLQGVDPFTLLPTNLQQTIANSLSWHVSLSPQGNRLAVLRNYDLVVLDVDSDLNTKEHQTWKRE